jgi:hypothetical protein
LARPVVPAYAGMTPMLFPNKIAVLTNVGTAIYLRFQMI